LAIIGRKDVKTNDPRLFIPGGMIDPGEDPISAAMREATEETGFLKHLPPEERRDALSLIHCLPVKPLGTKRLTINSGQAEVSVVLVAKNPSITKHPLKGGDDAAYATWIPLTRDVLTRLYGPHANDVKLGVLKYEKQNGVRIAPNGTLHT